MKRIKCFITALFITITLKLIFSLIQKNKERKELETKFKKVIKKGVFFNSIEYHEI